MNIPKWRIKQQLYLINHRPTPLAADFMILGQNLPAKVVNKRAAKARIQQLQSKSRTNNE